METMNTANAKNGANGKLVWIDCEMTGLNIDTDELVEVAVIITDYDLNQLADGFTIVIKPSAAALDAMGEFVTEMHRSSGLLDELSAGDELADAEQKILDYISEHIGAEGTAPLAGNSIATDRAFIAKYLPKVDSYLHYRNIDVSSVKMLAKHWFPRVFFHAPEKNGGHRALADIQESIRELDYYRRILFVAEPGPTSDEAKAAAEVTTAKYLQYIQ